MKVLFISSLLRGGGAEVFLYELVRGLRIVKGVEVVILSGDRVGTDLYQNLTYILPNSKLYFQEWLLGLADPLKVSIIRSILRKERPDIVHLNNFLGLGVAVTEACSKEDIPVVATIHDYWPICPKTTLIYEDEEGSFESPCTNYQRCLSNRCVKLTRALPYLNYLADPLFKKHRRRLREVMQNWVVVSVSNYLRELLESWGLRNVKLIYNGRTFKEIDLSLEAWLSRDTVFYPGGPRLEKGYRDVAKLVRALCYDESIEKPQFKIAVRGNAQDFNCRSLRLEVSHYFNDPIAYYRNSFLTLIPSICQETLSYTAIEAIAYGSLVLAYRVGGVPEVIRNAKFLVEPGNFRLFYEKTLEIVKGDRKHLYEELQVLRDYVIKTFNSYKMVEEYYKLYEEVLGGV